MDRALPIARSTGNHFHEVRLQLVRAFAHRNSGNLTESQRVAEEAVRVAKGNRQEAIAAVGLSDLGAAYLQGGKPAEAERYLEQSLSFAPSAQADFTEARAALQWAALHVQYKRPARATPFLNIANIALPFFRSGGHHREAVQGSLLQGSIETRETEYQAAEATLREAVERGKGLQDRDNFGLAHAYLAGLLQQTGRLPEAVDALTRALELFGDLRGGYLAAHTISSRAFFHALLGKYVRAQADLAEAEKWAARLQGNPAQVRAMVAMTEAEVAFQQGRWAEALRHARQSRAAHGDEEVTQQAAPVEALSDWHLRHAAGAAATARNVVAALEKSGGSAHAVAMARLRLAEAMPAPAEAAAARTFFESHRNWEAVWRCWRALGGGIEHGPAQQAALTELRRAWPDQVFATYLARPDFGGVKLP